MQPDMPPKLLAVDLDGTLLRSDMVHECFWSALGSNLRGVLRALPALAQGRAAFRQRLSGLSNVDIATLPFDEAVIARISAWRGGGGRVVLVSACEREIAEAIAAHLGLFDEVLGPDCNPGFGGAERARLLTERYGKGGYVYLGGSVADLPVWENAAKAIVARATPALREATTRLRAEVEYLGSGARPLAATVRAMRPHQWTKNILVFLPMLTAHLFTLSTLLQSLLAFIAFSLVASSVYVLNDLLDLAADRAHPRKCRRPFAAGELPVSRGGPMAGMLLGAGLLASLPLGMPFLSTMAIYLTMTTAYSLALKQRAVADICVLALLYAVRILAGGSATGIPLSVWLLAFAIFFFLSLAAVKRQAELVDSARRGKLDLSGRGYSVDDLPVISMMAIGAGYVSVLVLALYINSDNVTEVYPSPVFLWGICFVLLYWIGRIVMIAHRGQMHDDPLIFAVRDNTSRICLTVILGFVIAGSVM